jgi:hypothetical protein
MAEWHPLLTAYGPTLVNLVINVDSPFPFLPLELELPVLAVLSLIVRHPGLRLITPRLRYLISIDNSFLRLTDLVVTTKNVVSLAWLGEDVIPAHHCPCFATDVF